jgi:hypothetical protein
MSCYKKYDLYTLGFHQREDKETINHPYTTPVLPDSKKFVERVIKESYEPKKKKRCD